METEQFVADDIPANTGAQNFVQQSIEELAEVARRTQATAEETEEQRQARLTRGDTDF